MPEDNISTINNPSYLEFEKRIMSIIEMPNEKYFYTSSNLIKRVHLHGGRETDLVPPNVLESLNDLRKRRMTPEV